MRHVLLLPPSLQWEWAMKGVTDLPKVPQLLSGAGPQQVWFPSSLSAHCAIAFPLVVRTHLAWNAAFPLGQSGRTPLLWVKILVWIQENTLSSVVPATGASGHSVSPNLGNPSSGFRDDSLLPVCSLPGCLVVRMWFFIFLGQGWESRW